MSSAAVVSGALRVKVNPWVHTYPYIFCHFSKGRLGWSGGAMVLGKLPVPGRPTNLDKSRARAYCTYCTFSRCGCFFFVLFLTFFSHLSFLFSFSLSPGDGQI